MEGRRFTVQGTNNSFTCGCCKSEVQPLKNGSVRNHCPNCLHSKHVDVHPGDRASNCLGDMKPIGLEQSGKKGWVILHCCQQCGYVGRNKAALDDPEQPDNWEAMIAIGK